jgi:hypothetical protein
MTNTPMRRMPQNFERRLMIALRSYAAEVPVDTDALAIARATTAIVRGRRRPWFEAVARWPRGVRIATVAALVIAAGMIGLLIVGALRDREPTIVGPLAPPAALEGRWLAIAEIPGAVGAENTFHVDFGGDVLLKDWVGQPLAWAGRSVEIRPTEVPDRWILRVEAPAPCGPGTYRVGVIEGFVQFSVIEDSCPDRVALLEFSAWTRPGFGYLVPGETYEMTGFSEPFALIGPRGTIEGGLPALQLQDDPSLVRLSGFPEDWNATFMDDRPVYEDACARTTLLPDVPATPGEVGDWLRGMPSARVAEPVEVPVDGRMALLYHVDDSRCPDGDRLTDGHAIDVYLTDLVYAIPTGDDTILFLVSLPSYNPEEIEQVATDLVGSIDFR